MLPHYSAFKVAEKFRILETLFPGRIDLGIGRAPGSDQRTMRVLADGKPNGALPPSIRSRCATSSLAARCAARQPQLRGVLAQPAGGTAPDVWLLGSSDEGGARRPLRPAVLLCAFHQPGRRRGRDARLPCPLPAVRPPSAPKAMMAMGVMCAETDTEADLLSKSRELWATRLRTQNEPGPFPSVEEALAAEKKPRITGPHGVDAPSRRHRLTRDGARRRRRSGRRATASRRSCW